MSQIHRDYNLIFVNEIFRNTISKTCKLIDIGADPTYVNLSTYLCYLQIAENIVEFALPEIDKFLSGSIYDDISQETVEIKLGQINTQIRWNGKTETIPTDNFITVLQEYADFLKTPPVDASKI
jgi:hypothetical protein